MTGIRTNPSCVCGDPQSMHGEFLDDDPTRCAVPYCGCTGFIARGRTVALDITIDTSGFVAAMQRLTDMLKDWTTADGRWRRVDAHHPRPLGIDGYAYRRRTLARRRRNR